MIRSMTGYGRREAGWASGSVAVELKSVNHRFCEVVMRLPKGLSSLEDELKRLIQHRCARGRIDLVVSVLGGKEGEKTLSLDRLLARRYYQLFRDLQRELKLAGSVDVALLAGCRDVVSVSEQPLEDGRLKRLVPRLVRGALSDLDAMRRREGGALARDLRHRLRVVRDEVARIEARAPLVVREYFERMKVRVEKLLGGAAPDSGRLAQELAQYADRCDVSEELTRLGSHLTQFELAVSSREAVGRTLDFLLQELGREVNTIGSKANDAEISRHVVTIKGELEKLREQVQNIE